MAIGTPVLLSTSADRRNTANGQATYDVTLSRAIAAGEKVLVAVDLTGTTPPDTGTLAGGGVTWTKVGSQQFGVHRQYLFEAHGGAGGGSGTTLTFSINDAGFSATGCNFDVVAIPGAAATLPQSPATFGSSSASSGTATLGSAPAATSAGIGFAASASGGESNNLTFDASFTELADIGNTAPNLSMGCAYDVGSPPTSLTVAEVTAGNAAFMIWYVEVAEASGAQTVTPGLLGGAQLFSPTVKQAVVATLLGGALLFAPTVNQTVAPGLLGGSQTFAPTVEQADTITPDLLGGAQVFAPTLVQGQFVTPGLLGPGQTFAPTIVSTTVLPDLLGGAQTFAPTIVQEQLVAPGLLGPGQVFAPGIVRGIAGPGLLGGAQVFAPTVYIEWEVILDGTDRTAYVRPYTEFETVSRAYQGSGVARIPLVIEDDAFTPAVEDTLQVKHRSVVIFEGFARQVARADLRDSAGPRKYIVQAQDMTTLLDMDVIETAYRSTTESDKARVTWLVSTHGSKGVTAGDEVQQILASMPEGTDGRPEQDFSGKTLREAIEQVASITGASYYVDFDKALHYFLTETEAAPFDVSDAPNDSTTFKFSDFTLTDDSVDSVHRVLVRGEGISVWRELGTLPAAADIREAVINDSSITSTAQASEVGDAFLARHGTTERSGRFTVWRPGLRAGQTIAVTHAGFGLIAEDFHIVSVTTKALGANQLAYSVEIGSPEHTLSTVVGGRGGLYQAVQGAGAQAQVTQGQLRELQAAGANLVHDSSFEASTAAAWTVGSGWTHGHEPAAAFRGSKTARLVLAAATAGTLVPAAKIPVDRTDDYWVSAWSYLSAYTSGTARMVVKEYNSSNTLLATTVVAELTAAETGWTRHKIRFGNTAAQGRFAWQATTASVEVAFDSNSANATLTWDVDGVQLERGSLLTAYAPMPEELYNVPGEVVIDASGVTIINGALTVKNPGGTVIIDGTSEMFKIQASGTYTATAPAATTGSYGNIDTGVDTSVPDTTPAFLTYIAKDSSATDERGLGSYWDGATVAYMGNSDGAETTTIRGLRLNSPARAGMKLAGGSTQVNFSIWIGNTSSVSSVTYNTRWYVLKEAGI